MSIGEERALAELPHRTARSAVTDRSKVRKALLAGGIIASLLYVATDILAGKLWAGYSFVARSISELSAVGAPTRPLVVPLNLTAAVLLIAFAYGVRARAGRSRARRITAVMLFGNAAFQLIGAFFPLHLGEALRTSANTVNTVVMGISVLCLVLAIGFGAAAYRGWFRFCSIGIFLVWLAGYVWATQRAPIHVAGQRGPTVGAQERTMMYSYLLWIVALAVVLLRKEKWGQPPFFKPAPRPTRPHQETMNAERQQRPTADS